MATVLSQIRFWWTKIDKRWLQLEYQCFPKEDLYLIAVKAGVPPSIVSHEFCRAGLSTWKELDITPAMKTKAVRFVVPFKVLALCIPDVDFRL